MWVQLYRDQGGPRFFVHGSRVKSCRFFAQLQYGRVLLVVCGNLSGLLRCPRSVSARVDSVHDECLYQ